MELSLGNASNYIISGNEFYINAEKDLTNIKSVAKYIKRATVLVALKIILRYYDKFFLEDNLFLFLKFE